MTAAAQIDFPDAVRALLNGAKVRRASWAPDWHVYINGAQKFRLVDGRSERTMFFFSAEFLARDWEVLP